MPFFSKFQENRDVVEPFLQELVSAASQGKVSLGDAMVEARKECQVLLDQIAPLALPNTFTVTKDGIKIHENQTYNTFFDLIKSKHWHTMQCGKKVCTSPHSESLWDHLFECGSQMFALAKLVGYNPVKAFFGGFFHDCGKPGAHVFAGPYNGFKGHGLVGGALISDDLFSQELLDMFGLTVVDWADISTAADIHMCGFFQSVSTALDGRHMQAFRLQREAVRELLVLLRVGDNLSMLVHEEKVEEHTKSLSDFVDRQFEFTKSISQAMGLGEYMRILKQNYGMLVKFQGGSGCGKTSERQKLVDGAVAAGVDPKDIVEVERDEVAMRIIQKMRNLPVTPWSEMTDEIYNENIQWHNDNDKPFSQHINAEILRMVTEGLLSGKLVLVDTLVTLFPMQISGILPEDVLAETFVMDLWKFRPGDKPYTDGNHGMNIANQIKASCGARSIPGCPLPAPTQAIGYRGLISKHEFVDPLEEAKPWQADVAMSMPWSNLKDCDREHWYRQIADGMAYQKKEAKRMITLEETMNLSLRELVSNLLSFGGWDALEKWFKTKNYSVKMVDDNTVLLKYKDGINDIWRYKWAREARGRAYFLSDDGVVFPIKDTLQRGVEVKTRKLAEAGISETQDDTALTRDSFDVVQKAVTKMWQSKTAKFSDGYFTLKADGSLLVWSYYPKTSAQYGIMKELASRYKRSMTLETEGGLWVAATQGTIFMPPAMEDFYLTTLVDVLGLPRPSADVDPLVAWTNIQEPVRDLLNNLLSATPAELMDGQMINYCLEIIVKNRKTYRGVVHTELAVTYDRSALVLLGAMHGEQYHPHFTMPDTEQFVEHPLSLKIESTDQGYDFMDDMASIPMDQMTEDEFLGKWFPGSKGFKGQKPQIHIEGVVFLWERTPENMALVKELVGSLDHYTMEIGGWDYSKIKLTIYYEAHKVRVENVEKLSKLPKVAGRYFAAVAALQRFMETMGPNLHVFAERFMAYMLQHESTESPAFKALPPKAQSGPAKKFLEMAPDAKGRDKLRETFYKMVINEFQALGEEVYRPLMEELFGVVVDMEAPAKLAAATQEQAAILKKTTDFKTKKRLELDFKAQVDALKQAAKYTEQMISWAKKFVMEMQPWKEGAQERIERLAQCSLTDDTSLLSLLFMMAVIKSNVAE